MNDQNLSSIVGGKSKTFGELIGMYLKSPWYFDKWYEKLILLGLGFLGFWRILGWFI